MTDATLSAQSTPEEGVLGMILGIGLLCAGTMSVIGLGGLLLWMFGNP